MFNLSSFSSLSPGIPRQLADRLRPVVAGLVALHQGVKAVGEGIVEFFSLLPTALASGAADTMAAHGRDPDAGLEFAFDFDASGDEDWEEAMRFHREMHSYYQAVNGFYPTDPKHFGLYLMNRHGRHG